MLEWKASLRTKDPLTAQRLWVQENQRFAEAESIAEALLDSKQGKVSGTEALRIAKHIAVKAGFHPTQAPRLPDHPTDADWEKYKSERAEWDGWLDAQRDILTDVEEQESTDHEQMAKDYRTGRWIEPDYKTPYKPANPNGVLQLTRKILDGELTPALEPTWQDAVDLYISVNKQEKIRDLAREKKWEIKTRGLLDRFSAAHGKGLKLTELDRSKIRIWLQQTYENQATRNRYINTLSAVINTWNRECPNDNVTNPFSGLANKQRAEESSQKRLSFKPNQFSAFIDAINKHPDEEVRLIGLLMAWTGCRTSEAAGLTVRDVKLDAEPAHIIYRSNKVRRMGKGGLERAVPLVEPILTVLQAYKAPSDKEAAFFKKHGNPKGFENVSAALRYILSNKANIDDDGLVPYSLRHTLKDRMAAAGIDTSLAEYILGHVSKGSSQIHKRYGTMTPPKALLDALNRAIETETWGYFEDV